MKRLSSYRPVFLLASCVPLLLLALPPSSGVAQAGSGTVEGIAKSADTGAPIPFALVVLLPAIDSDSTGHAILTNAEGRFRFTRVRPGDYRLQLNLIGYDRSPGSIFQVQPEGISFQEIRSTIAPIQIPGITVGAAETCFTADKLAQDPWLDRAWTNVRLGVEIRRAFELQFRFTRRIDQEVTIRRRLFPDSRFAWSDTAYNEPDSVLARDQRYWAEHRAGNYIQRGPKSFLITLFDEKELLQEEFLHTHCLDASADERDGAFILGFRPVQPAQQGTNVRGVIWIDRNTYLTRRIQYEYFDGSRSIALTTIDYSDLTVDGSKLRLPTSGTATGRPNRMVLLSSAFTYTYAGFEPVSR